MASTVTSSAKGVSYLILIQLCSRASTFIVNQALLRYLTPELFGISIRLELYSITVLYFARESLRVALQRQASNLQAVINLGYIALGLGLPLSVVSGWRYAASDSSDIPYMQEAIWLFAAATIIELLSEPCFAVVQQKLAYGIRAAAETAATISRCLVTFGAVMWYERHKQPYGALPFAYGQLAYAIVLSVVYFARLAPVVGREGCSLLLRPIRSSDQSEYIFSYFSRSICSLSLNMYVQSSIKYVLTQGDSIMIATFASLQDQGVYGLASNYGGLIARIIFQPVEESSRNLFAKLCGAEEKVVQSSESPAMADAKDGNDCNADLKSSKTKKQVISPSSNVGQAHIILTSVIRLYALLALVCCSLGPSVAPILLDFVAGKAWSSTGAGTVLATYTYYIPLLAINGVTEAFVAAVANNAQLRTQSIAMAFYFVGFAGAVYVFLQVAELGAKGLVWANCVNMGCRIIWNLWFIEQYFRSKTLTFNIVTILPTASSLAASAIATGALRLDNPIRSLTASAILNELAWAGAIGAFLGAAMLFSERRFLGDCFQMINKSSATH